MMTSAFISKLRRRYNDLPILHQDSRVGDGSSTVYKTQFHPIKEGSFNLYIGGVLQSSSGYTIDLDTGDINLAAATSSQINANYQEVKFRDQHWLEAIQSAVESLGDQFFRSVIGDVSSMSISAGVQKCNCPSSCIKLLRALESDNYTLNGNWVRPQVNTRYDRRSNVLILGSKPSRNNYMLISYLRKLAIPDSTSDILDVEDNWKELIDLKSGSYFYNSQAGKVALQGNATVEEGHLAMAQIRALANDNEVKFENLKKKLKPVMPASEIPYNLDNAGPVF